MKPKIKREKRFRRHKRVRAKISGTSKRPRLCVFKSNKHIYAQLIDDENGRTLAATSDQEIKNSKTEPRPSLSFRKGGTKVKMRTKLSSSSESVKEKKEEAVRAGKVVIAFEVGKLIAEKAIKDKIEKVIFDKAGYRYQGRVKALAEGAREGGLKF